MADLFFFLSKVGWNLFKPDSILVFLILFLWLLLVFNRYRLAKWVCSGLTILTLFIAFFPVGSWLVSPLERQFPANPQLPDQVEGIILLGGTVIGVRSDSWQSVELGASAEREFAFLSLARRYPEAKLVFTGGSGSLAHQAHKEADYIRLLFEQQGFDVGRILFEDQSRNTFENALNTKALVQPSAGEYWVLITSAAHIKRSVGVFCQQGWPVKPYSVDHLALKLPLNEGVVFAFSANLDKLSMVLREYLGLLMYQQTGKAIYGQPDCVLD